MMKHLKKKFPDICKQVFEMKEVYNRAIIEDTIVQFSKSFGQKVIAYEHWGKKVIAYTSKKFTDLLKTMKKGDTVLDSNVGKVGIIVSDEPFFCSCTLCVRVDFGDTVDVYDCTYFM